MSRFTAAGNEEGSEAAHEEQLAPPAPRQCERCHEDFGGAARCEWCGVHRNRRVKKIRVYAAPFDEVTS